MLKKINNFATCSKKQSMEVDINDKVRKDVKFIYDEVIRKVKQTIELTENLKMTNDQFFLNFLDDLNELSIKY